LQEVRISYSEQTEKYSFNDAGVCKKWYSATYDSDSGYHEWIYDPATDVPINYTFKKKWIKGVRGNIFAFSYSLASKQTINLSAALAFKCSVDLAAAINVSVGVGIGIDLGFSASLKFKLDTGLAANLVIKTHGGGNHTIDLVSGKTSSDLPWTKAYKEAKFKAEKQGIIMGALETQLEKCYVHFETKNTKLIKSEIQVIMGQIFSGI